MQVYLSVASIVINLCVIWHIYRMGRQLTRLERSHRNLCDVLGIKHEFVGNPEA